MAKYVVTLARNAGLVLLFLLAAVLGTASGVFFAFAGDLPQISALDDYAPSTITRVYDMRGAVVGEFATQRRVVIRYSDISPTLRSAILAAEDKDFFHHFGLSLPHIAIAATRDAFAKAEGLVTGHYSRPKGASTITQQLARNLFAHDIGFKLGDTSPERKIKEAIVTLQIEKRYTKEEIFAFYANQMYLGEGAYGVEAAARTYFGKSAKDLTLDESALIAALFNSGLLYDPMLSMDRALGRRAYVLDRMAEDGFITQKQAEAAKGKPIVLASTRSQSIAPYFLEEVRKQLEAKYGAKELYENGLTVQTGLDLTLQAVADRALDDGLRRLDHRHGFRKPRRNVIDERHTIDGFKDPRWDRPFAVGDVVPAIVESADAVSIRLRAGTYQLAIERKAFAWTHKTAATDLVRPGDLVEARLLTLDAGAHTGTALLDQPPLVQGAILAIDNHTGQIRAMIGGSDFDRSKFNRATQALRQVGSAFKPFVYTAAIDRGYTPATLIDDSPVIFPANGPNQPPYAPHNYEHDFWGPITLRRALEHSRNVPAVKLMAALGPNQVIAYARRFGLTAPIPPYLPVALGAAEQSLIEMTSAYSVFPNQGVRIPPYSIIRVTDREGNVLEENRPQPQDAIRADTAFVLTNMLRGVVERGTGAKAAALKWPIAGKTGTTEDWTDAWFIGFDPDLTLGVWVGYDLKKTLGHGMDGAAAALPIWIDIFKTWIGDRKDPPQFQAPGNIVFVPVDRTTGVVADPTDPDVINEAFIAGTQPGSIKQ